MRDPKRISNVCAIVERAWHDNFPEWRFMQLMSNFALWYGADPFYMEDDIFIAKFLDFVAAMKGERD